MIEFIHLNLVRLSFYKIIVRLFMRAHGCAGQEINASHRSAYMNIYGAERQMTMCSRVQIDRFRSYYNGVRPALLGTVASQGTLPIHSV